MWFALPWNIRWDDVALNRDLHQILTAVFAHDSALPVAKKDIPLFQVSVAIVIDQIWKFRNKLVFQGHLDSMETVIPNLLSRISEFSSVLKPQTNSSSQPRQPSSWCTPPTAFLKLNVDITVKDGWCFGAILVRDHAAKVVLLFGFQEACF